MIENAFVLTVHVEVVGTSQLRIRDRDHPLSVVLEKFAKVDRFFGIGHDSSC
jgi:hypothetical protein